MAYIKDFSEIGKGDAAIAGGKGASLGEMTSAFAKAMGGQADRYNPVPPGFVLLSSAFEHFLDETNLNVEIDAILTTVNTEEMRSVEHASERIQKLILEAKMPKDIGKEIQKNFKILDAEPTRNASHSDAGGFVAVRSSATAEDSNSAAWAGQLDTFLNTTEENLLENVQKCWASLFTSRAIFYRFEHFQQHPNILENVGMSAGIHGAKISVAVVVQKMIQSEISGIAFTVHPVTEDRNQLIIEAGWGLGEAIVSGQITPDSYVVEKNPRRIIDINIVNQERGIYRALSSSSPAKGRAGRGIDGTSTPQSKMDSSPQTGERGTLANEWRDIPENKRAEQKLSNEQILELAELVIKIEKHYDFPCDIEWAVGPVIDSEVAQTRGEHVEGKGGKFYITQSRPITTLSPQVPVSEDSKKKFKKAPVHFVKTLERDQTLFVQGLWAQGLDIDLEKRFGMKNPYRPMILTYATKDNLQVWENMKSVQWMLDAFLKKNQKNTDFIDKVIEEYNDLTKELQAFWSRGAITDKKEIQQYANLVRKASLNISTCYYVGMDERTPKKIQDLVVEVRKEDIFYSRNNEFVRECVAAQDGRLRDFSPFILSWELGNFPSEDILKARAKGAILIAGKEFFTENIQEFSRKYPEYVFDNLNATIGENESIVGQTTFPGIVAGRVRIVKNLKRLPAVKSGDILVAPMTTPDYMPAMQRAAAFVTDEGGVTCHAAIVAREMKKPCIIGTKIATQVLKDGDMVEVDADKGIVKILEKNVANNKLEKRIAHYLSQPMVKMGQWVLLPADQENWHGEKSAQYFEDFFGFSKGLPNIYIVETGMSSNYCPQKFFDELYDYIRNLTKNDFLALEKKLSGFPKLKRETKKKLAKISSHDFTVLSNEALAEAYKKNRDLIHSIVLFDNFGMSAEDYWPPLMHKILAEKMKLTPETTKYNQTLFALTKPKEISTSLEEKRDVLEKALRIMKKKETLQEAAAVLTEKYEWLPVFAYGTPWRESHYVEELEQTIKRDEKELQEEYEKLMHYDRIREEEMKKIVDQYSLVPEDLQIFVDFGLAVDARNEAEFVVSFGGYCLLPIYREISHRLGISEKDLRLLFEKEIVDCLEGRADPKKLLAGKGKFIGFGFDDTMHGRFNLTEEEARALYDYLEANTKVSGQGDSGARKGVCASPGKVSGLTRILKSSEENGKVKRGDILVSYATTVDYLPAMKNAAGIVTETGGLTCHAAVVAREFGIPCIVGLKNAMTDFRDGNLVEVDADKGVVRIIHK